MFANTTQVGFGRRAVATLVSIAVLLASIGFYVTAEAASLVDVSNTLTDSNPDALSGHDIEFNVPVGSSIASGNDISITFPPLFGGNGPTQVADLVIANITATVNGGAVTEANFTAVGQVVTFDGVTAVAGDLIRIVIPEGLVDNPDVVDSYEFEISIANTGLDSGKTRVAIVDNVEVTAIVETTFDFVISGLATSTTVNGTSTTGSTTPTEIPFGVLTADVDEMLGQRLNVTTNARTGFVVTVETDGDLQSANGAIIDTFFDGTDVSTPTNWAANLPSEDINDRLTWGHWGLVSSDSDLAAPFAAGTYIAASTTPRAVFTHDGPSDGTTADAGQVDVAYRIVITDLQEAADDYTTTLTYIATPTF